MFVLRLNLNYDKDRNGKTQEIKSNETQLIVKPK